MKLFYLIVYSLINVVFGSEVPRLSNFRPRVVGGTDAAPEEFPHQVSLFWGNEKRNQHICGGSIISPNWILTAGHCVTEVPKRPGTGYFAVVGTNKLVNLTSDQKIKVVEKIVHPKYKGGVNPNDIALLKLENSLKFNKAVKPIKLPRKNKIPEGHGTISGWGSTSKNMKPSMPQNLMTAELPLISFDECKEALVNLTGSDKPLEETNVCTGPLDGDKGACSGDSGGPLTQGEILIGIVSWGMIPCGTKGAPSVFTRTSAFIDFIQEHVEDLKENY